MMICDAGIWLCRLWVSHVSVSCCARVTGSGHTGRYLKIVLFMFLRLYNQFCPRLKWPDRRSRTRRTSTLRICPTPWRRATSRPCSRLMDRLLWTSSTLSSTLTSSWQGILRDTDHHYYHLFIMITITIGCVNSNSPGHKPTVSRGRVRQDGE